ncbi:hypothetical protein E2562_019222 [Oryza meyeriana var. granulata]|uniref:Uncharacterized protein n=1 Tax=Oryza meyeriana var. granulata TaxID=110450 RepID=A0A6G1F9Z2_9ORYZ|nr:hypothetical protein E2562_019222 [Oryza meyeriana var. granulata]
MNPHAAMPLYICSACPSGAAVIPSYKAPSGFGVAQRKVVSFKRVKGLVAGAGGVGKRTRGGWGFGQHRVGGGSPDDARWDLRKRSRPELEKRMDGGFEKKRRDGWGFGQHHRVGGGSPDDARFAYAAPDPGSLPMPGYQLVWRDLTRRLALLFVAGLMFCSPMAPHLSALAATAVVSPSPRPSLLVHVTWGAAAGLTPWRGRAVVDQALQWKQSMVQ